MSDSMVRNDRVTVWLEPNRSDRSTGVFKWHATLGETYDSLAGPRSPRGEIRQRWKREVGTDDGSLLRGAMREGRVVRALDDGTVRVRLDLTGRRIRAIPEE